MYCSRDPVDDNEVEFDVTRNMKCIYIYNIYTVCVYISFTY